MLSEKGEHVTEDQFHIITTEDSFVKSDSSGDTLKTSGQVTEKLRKACMSLYDERNYFKG